MTHNRVKGKRAGKRGRMRNTLMAERIEAAPAAEPVRFACAGDSGAWADPTSDAIYGQLVRQVAQLDPPPAFFVNLGDFAGPGTRDRHDRYLELVASLDLPSLCVVGNHDLDDDTGKAVFDELHGPTNFTFACGHTRFVALQSAERMEGPQDGDLAFLDRALAGAAEPNRVVLTHIPPYLDGHYAPHDWWGFRRREREFLDLLREHHVTLVCCAHGLAFDTVVRDGVRFVMSGGGGSGLCSDRTGICSEGEGHPEDRGALFHFVELEIAESGAVSGRVHQAFGGPRFGF